MMEFTDTWYLDFLHEFQNEKTLNNDFSSYRFLSLIKENNSYIFGLLQRIVNKTKKQENALFFKRIFLSCILILFDKKKIFQELFEMKYILLTHLNEIMKEHFQNLEHQLQASLFLKKEEQPVFNIEIKKFIVDKKISCQVKKSHIESKVFIGLEVIKDSGKECLELRYLGIEIGWLKEKIINYLESIIREDEKIFFWQDYFFIASLLLLKFCESDKNNTIKKDSEKNFFHKIVDLLQNYEDLFGKKKFHKEMMNFQITTPAIIYNSILLLSLISSMSQRQNITLEKIPNFKGIFSYFLKSNCCFLKYEIQKNSFFYFVFSFYIRFLINLQLILNIKFVKSKEYSLEEIHFFHEFLNCKLFFSVHFLESFFFNKQKNDDLVPNLNLLLISVFINLSKSIYFLKISSDCYQNLLPPSNSTHFLKSFLISRNRSILFFHHQSVFGQPIQNYQLLTDLTYFQLKSKWDDLDFEAVHNKCLIAGVTYFLLGILRNSKLIFIIIKCLEKSKYCCCMDLDIILKLLLNSESKSLVINHIFGQLFPAFNALTTNLEKSVSCQTCINYTLEIYMSHKRRWDCLSKMKELFSFQFMNLSLEALYALSDNLNQHFKKSIIHNFLFSFLDYSASKTSNNYIEIDFSSIKSAITLLIMYIHDLDELNISFQKITEILNKIVTKSLLFLETKDFDQMKQVLLLKWVLAGCYKTSNLLDSQTQTNCKTVSEFDINYDEVTNFKQKNWSLIIKTILSELEFENLSKVFTKNLHSEKSLINFEIACKLMFISSHLDDSFLRNEVYKSKFFSKIDEMLSIYLERNCRKINETNKNFENFNFFFYSKKINKFFQPEPNWIDNSIGRSILLLKFYFEECSFFKKFSNNFMDCMCEKIKQYLREDEENLDRIIFCCRHFLLQTLLPLSQGFSPLREVAMAIDNKFLKKLINRKILINSEILEKGTIDNICQKSLMLLIEICKRTFKKMELKPYDEQRYSDSVLIIFFIQDFIRLNIMENSFIQKKDFASGLLSSFEPFFFNLEKIDLQLAAAKLLVLLIKSHTSTESFKRLFGLFTHNKPLNTILLNQVFKWLLSLSPYPSNFVNFPLRIEEKKFNELKKWTEHKSWSTEETGNPYFPVSFSSENSSNSSSSGINLQETLISQKKNSFSSKSSSNFFYTEEFLPNSTLEITKTSSVFQETRLNFTNKIFNYSGSVNFHENKKTLKQKFFSKLENFFSSERNLWQLKNDSKIKSNLDFIFSPNTNSVFGKIINKKTLRFPFEIYLAPLWANLTGEFFLLGRNSCFSFSFWLLTKPKASGINHSSHLVTLGSKHVQFQVWLHHKNKILIRLVKLLEGEECSLISPVSSQVVMEKLTLKKKTWHHVTLSFNHFQIQDSKKYTVECSGWIDGKKNQVCVFSMSDQQKKTHDNEKFILTSIKDNNLNNKESPKSEKKKSEIINLFIGSCIALKSNLIENEKLSEIEENNEITDTSSFLFSLGNIHIFKGIFFGKLTSRTLFNLGPNFLLPFHSSSLLSCYFPNLDYEAFFSDLQNKVSFIFNAAQSNKILNFTNSNCGKNEQNYIVEKIYHIKNVLNYSFKSIPSHLHILEIIEQQGGIDFLLFFLARIFEISPEEKSQAEALEFFFKMINKHENLMQDFIRLHGYSLVSSILSSQKAFCSLESLKVLIELATNKSITLCLNQIEPKKSKIFKSSLYCQISDAKIIYELIIKSFWNSSEHFKISRDFLWSLIFDFILMLTSDEKNKFSNVCKLEEEAIFGKLLDLLLERLYDKDTEILASSASIFVPSTSSFSGLIKQRGNFKATTCEMFVKVLASLMTCNVSMTKPSSESFESESLKSSHKSALISSFYNHEEKFKQRFKLSSFTLPKYINKLFHFFVLCHPSASFHFQSKPFNFYWTFKEIQDKIKENNFIDLNEEDSEIHFILKNLFDMLTSLFPTFPNATQHGFFDNMLIMKIITIYLKNPQKLIRLSALQFLHQLIKCATPNQLEILFKFESPELLKNSIVEEVLGESESYIGIFHLMSTILSNVPFCSSLFSSIIAIVFNLSFIPSEKSANELEILIESKKPRDHRLLVLLMALFERAPISFSHLFLNILIKNFGNLKTSQTELSLSFLQKKFLIENGLLEILGNKMVSLNSKLSEEENQISCQPQNDSIYSLNEKILFLSSEVLTYILLTPLKNLNNEIKEVLTILSRINRNKGPSSKVINQTFNTFLKIYAPDFEQNLSASTLNESNLINFKSFHNFQVEDFFSSDISFKSLRGCGLVVKETEAGIRLEQLVSMLVEWSTFDSQVSSDLRITIFQFLLQLFNLAWGPKSHTRIKTMVNQSKAKFSHLASHLLIHTLYIALVLEPNHSTDNQIEKVLLLLNSASSRLQLLRQISKHCHQKVQWISQGLYYYLNNNLASLHQSTRTCIEEINDFLQINGVAVWKMGKKSDRYFVNKINQEMVKCVNEFLKDQKLWIKQKNFSVLRKCINLLTKMTRRISDNLSISLGEIQMEMRKQFVNKIQKKLSEKMTIASFWAEIIHKLSHPLGSWYSEELYPQSWKLDSVEDSSGLRTRLTPCHLNIPSRLFLPWAKYKSKNEPITEEPLSFLIRHKEQPSFSVIVFKLHNLSHIEYSTACSLVTLEQTTFGCLLMDKKMVYYVAMESKKQLRTMEETLLTTIPLERVTSINKQWYMLRDVGLLLVSNCGNSYFFAFQSQKERNYFDSYLSSKKSPPFSSNPIDVLHEALNKWQSGEMSNFDYLMKLNLASGRSFDDVMQYPIMPLILSKYDSSHLDLRSTEFYRNLKKPICAQTVQQEEKRIENYEALETLFNSGSFLTPPYHCHNYISNAAIIYQYFFRLPPFSQLLIDFQGNNFDCPDRSFCNLKQFYQLLTSGITNDVRELSPEFFTLPEFLNNDEGFNFGETTEGKKIDDVILPSWSHDNPRYFTLIHRQALESEMVSKNLPFWIDLIFGYKQKGKIAKDSTNTFHPFTYYGAELNAIDDEVGMRAVLSQVRSCGQVPKQLFKGSHPFKFIKTSIFNKSDNLPSPIPGVLGLKWGKYVFSPEEPTPFVIWIKISSKKIWKLLQVSQKNIFAMSYLKDISIKKSELSWSLFMWGRLDEKLKVTENFGERKKLLLHWPFHHAKITCSTGLINEDIIFFGTNIGLIGAYSSASFCWQPLSSKCQYMWKSLVGHSNRVNILVPNQSFRLLISADYEGKIIYWDLNKLKFLRDIREHKSKIKTLAVSCTLGDVASSSHIGFNSKIILCSINGKKISEKNVENDLIRSMAFSNRTEGNHINVLLCGFESGCIRSFCSWNLLPLNEVWPFRSLNKPDAPISCLSFFFKDLYVVGCTPFKTIFILSHEAYRPLSQFQITYI